MTVENRKTSNLSEYINPKNCSKCGGKCCKQFWIYYPKDWDEIFISEMKRIQMLSGMEDKVKIVETEKSYQLIFDIPCKHLSEDGKCKIYNSPNRPLLCRKYPYNNTEKDQCEYVMVK